MGVCEGGLKRAESAVYAHKSCANAGSMTENLSFVPASQHLAQPLVISEKTDDELHHVSQPEKR